MMSLPALAAELLRTAPLVYHAPTRKDQLQRVKYFARALFFWRETSEWLALLRAPRFAKLVECRPRVYSRLQRPYLTCQLTTAQKMAALRAHYAFVAEQLPEAVFAAISQNSHWPLATLILDETETIGVALRFCGYEKEGELSVSLRSETTHEWICSISFTVAQWSPDQREIQIGGLQGHGFSDEKARTISITRGMKGLRPKALVLFALQQLAIQWKATRLSAVSNDLHIYRSIQKRRDLHADYNTFWEESGGTLEADGLFSLPIVPPVRDMADIKPNKRSTYRQRYALLDTLGADIRASIACS